MKYFFHFSDESHCADMGSISSDDSLQLTSAKNAVPNMISYWLA